MLSGGKPHASSRTRHGERAEEEIVVHDAHERATSIPILLFLCLLWYTSSALSSNTSKSLLSRRKVVGEDTKLPPLFPYPVTLTLVQFIFVNVFCYVGTRRHILGDWVLAKRLVPITWQQIREIVQISLFNVLGHALSSIAVSHVEVSLVHTIKALSPLFTVLSYALFFGVQYSSRTYVSLLPLISGVVLACTSLSKSKHDDMVGFVSALGSTLIVVAQNIYSKKLLKPAVSAATNAPEKLDKVNILFYSSACSVAIMLPMSLFYDAGHMVAATSPNVGIYTIYLLILNGIVHFAQNLLAFQVLAHVSPVTYSVANLFKRVFVILVAIAWFGQSVSFLQWIGIALTFVGLYMYNNAKNDKMGAKAQSVPSEPDVLPMHRRPTGRHTLLTFHHDDTNPAIRSDPQVHPGPVDIKLRMATPLFSLPPQ
ncbi:phosphoenolpyruvate transmembrane transporter [Malassezia pachydermatis]|uniref:Tpt-domain-containing protein n=1 Tax=Malassezia pachydermatis TaxID=77020 RepID=A0A0M8MJF8_9BASI|nr:tpt-domain-containing protein [Malassezia pachydermatis]KOS13696.1 tpt-domain-containing protein [Malassezia pachydermatis]